MGDAAPAAEEPPKKKRKSRFGEANPAAAAALSAINAAAAAAAAPAAAAAAAPQPAANPLLAAQQALQGSGLAGSAPAAAQRPTPGGGANAIPLGASGGAGAAKVEEKVSTIKPGPERLGGAKDFRGLTSEEAVAAAAPKANWDDPSLLGPAEEGVITELMAIPNEAVGLIIGRSGETIRQLQISAGADIQVSRDQGEERGIIIMGPPENVAAAKALVNRIVREKLASLGIEGGELGPELGPEGPPGMGMGPLAVGRSAGGDEEIFMIAQRHVGLIIGSGGQQIRQLQDNSGARIQVAKDPLPGTGHAADQRQVTLSGDPVAVTRAKQMIDELMAAAAGGGSAHSGGGITGITPGQVKEVMEIPSSCVGGVIGAQGRQIRYMQESSGAPQTDTLVPFYSVLDAQSLRACVCCLLSVVFGTGAHIQMQKNEDAKPGASVREVTVEGGEAQVATAVQMIQREVQQQQNRCAVLSSLIDLSLLLCMTVHG